MLQALIKKGQVFSGQVPQPQVSDGCVLIKVVHSCISAGTESSAVRRSGEALIAKLLKQPDQLGKAIKKIRSEGLFKTYNTVIKKRETTSAVGYSISGIVIATGKDTVGYSVGARVAAAGGGYANHAEVVNVPANLVVPIPEAVSLLDASSVALGAIAMQGVRRAGLALGDYCVVFGAGIIGMLTIQLLRSAGIRVAAVDIDDRRVQMAKKLGTEVAVKPDLEDSINAVLKWTGGTGADAVIFTASTASSDPLSSAFQMSRRKGRVVLVGVSGMNLRREDMYAKELDFIISTSYGPGRYDTRYEENGLDYPYPYVRWTENRNMSEYLRLLSSKQVDLEPITDGVYAIDDVAAAFGRLNASPKPLFLFLDYGGEHPEGRKEALGDKSIVRIEASSQARRGSIKTAVIGVGKFAKGTILPLLNEMADQYSIHAVAGRTGSKVKDVGREYGASYVTTDIEAVLNDQEVELVVVATRHDSHASIALRALRAGKHVFVEKPLAINTEELNEIVSFYREGRDGQKPLLTVGYNRRFSVYAKTVKRYVGERTGPLYIMYRMNAGSLPLDHWVVGREGGGRMIGEACHIIDLFTYLTESTIHSISCESLESGSQPTISSDNKVVILKYKDGSICVLNYFAVGNKELPKEYMEVHFDGKTLILDDYSRLHAYGLNIGKVETKVSEKGHREEWLELFKALRGLSGKWPIELWDMVQTSEATFIIK